MPTPSLRRVLLTAVIATGITTAAAPAGAAVTTPTAYSRAVTQICAHALLFEQSHEIGTRSGALELADDIRASGEHRLAQVAALPAPPVQRRLLDHWITLEHRLTETYATTYVRIYDLVAEERTTAEQRTEAAVRLARLMHAPDRLRRAAADLGRRLQLPDCTGT